MRLQGALSTFQPWTADEDAVLRAHYVKRGASLEIKRELPHRSQGAIFHRAKVLGLTTHRRWTESDDKRLADLWDSGVRVKEIAKALNRTGYTVYWRAQKLGLKLGCPDGFEYLTHAAERTGYTTDQLRKILRWAGVPIKLALTRPNQKQRHFHFVDPIDVDDAVAEWQSTEPLDTAAHRLGVSSVCLEYWLRFIGVTRPAIEGRCHWRVKHADVERASAARESHLSVRALGLLLGVNHYSLRRALVKAGVGVQFGRRRYATVEQAKRITEARV